MLAEALRDKSVHVRRRSMASLGELLFYVATQQQVCHWQPGGMVGSVAGGRKSCLAALCRVAATEGSAQHAPPAGHWQSHAIACND